MATGATAPDAHMLAEDNTADYQVIELIDPPRPDDYWRTLAVVVRIDSSRLVRRIAWSPTVGMRLKPGWLPRLATLLNRSSTSDHGIYSEGRLWNIIEFWDYGCHVEINAPTDLLDPGGSPPLRPIALDLWRKRQQYRKRTR